MSRAGDGQSRAKRSRVVGGWATSGPSNNISQARRGLGGNQPPTQAVTPQNKPFLFQPPSQEDKVMAGEETTNFSWVLPGLLAGSAKPQRPSHLQFWKSQGIKYAINLTERKIPIYNTFPGVVQVHAPVVEFEPPCLPQVIMCVACVDKAKEENVGVVVHCYWGKGRTGTILACYLVKAMNMDPTDAIEKIRQLRPWSIETDEQEGTVFEYAEHLKTRDIS